jgi:hypothetical protein
MTAVLAPNTNAIAERFVKTIKDECLSKMVFFGEGMLRKAIAEFVEHYHTERNHQGLGNRLLRPGPTLPVAEGTVHRMVGLGGLLSFYHRRRRRAATRVLFSSREKVIGVGFAAAAELPVRERRTRAAEPAPGLDSEVGICSRKCPRSSSRTARELLTSHALEVTRVV